jgi:Mn2+/Fe2+ NRAMP family transporter
MKEKKSHHSLFLPLLIIGIIISIFAIFMIFLGQSIEHGEGFEIMGKRFIIAGIVTIGLGYFAEYYNKIKNSLIFFKYFLKNIVKSKKSYK